MTDQTNEIQRAAIHVMMDILQNMPLPDSLKKWDQTILLQITGQEDLFYEWTIQAGQWKITEGQTREPGIILRGKEIDFVREFSDINSSSKANVQMLPAGGKKSLSIGDALKYGTLKGNILQKLKGQWTQFSAEAEQRQTETIAVMQEALAVETKSPAFHVDEIINRSDLVEGRCFHCGKTYLGVARTPPDSMPYGITTMVAVQCQNCGVKLCSGCQEKTLKVSMWNGWKKTLCSNCGELFGPGKIFITALEPARYTPILLGDTRVALDPDLGVVHHQPDFQASILDGITYSLLQDKYTNNLATGGMMGNKYANDLKRSIGREAQEIGNEFFAGLVAKGAIMNSNEMTVSYQGVVNAQAAVPPINLGKIIVLYAQDIAGLQGHPVTLETMAFAYQFYLVDLQRYLAGIGVKFHNAEELVDWRVTSRNDNKENSVFVLVTNQRLLRVQGKIVGTEIKFLEGETDPRMVFRRESNPDTFISGFLFVVRTNKRIIWFTERSFKKDAFAVGNLDADAVLTETEYFEKSKLLLLRTDRNLLIWPEEKTLQTIPLADIARVETAVATVEKKTLLISHKVEQNKVVLYCPEKMEIDIVARDQEAVMEFCTRI